MPSTIRSGLIVAAAALALGASSVRADADTANVEVINNNSNDVAVYVFGADGESQRIGVVGRLDKRVLTIPAGFADGEFRIKVYSLESRSHEHVGRTLDAVKTRLLTLEDGESLQFVVAGNLAESTFVAGA